jgi:hypothetical protein
MAACQELIRISQVERSEGQNTVKNPGITPIGGTVLMAVSLKFVFVSTVVRVSPNASLSFGLTHQLLFERNSACGIVTP